MVCHYKERKEGRDEKRERDRETGGAGERERKYVMLASLLVFAPLPQCLPVHVFVDGFWTLKMSSATFRLTQSHWKSEIGWLLPLRGKWGWWKRKTRKNQGFEALSTLFRLEFLWKGKHHGSHPKIREAEGQQVCWVPPSPMGPHYTCGGHLPSQV